MTNGPARLRGAALTLAAALAVLAALGLPNDAARLLEPGTTAFPLEFPLLVLLLAILPGRGGRVAARVAGLALTAMVLIKLADMASHAAYGRPFEPVFDVHLLPAAWNLASGAIGVPAAAVVLAGSVLLAAIGGALLVVAAGRLNADLSGSRRVVAPFAVAVLAVTAFAPFSSADASRLVARHAATAWASLHDLAAFRAEAADEPFGDVPDAGLLGRLDGKDVLFVFVESYGRSALEGSDHAAPVRATLASAEDTMARAGFASASGWLASPTVGGQSWLAHGTFLSGLRIDNQRRYLHLVTSARATLVSDFRRAGWRTAAAVPAIRMAWPEAAFFGYDAIYDAHGLGYAGEPFNWVTMPDQYTLKAFQERELAGPGHKPLMAVLALISSHAPWTPIPPVIDWEAVGDGSVFNRWAGSGDPPEVVWRDPERVRAQYRLSIRYVLDTLASFVARHGDPNLVLIVLGDHQPAPLVTGRDAGRDVPVHVIAKDPEIVRAAEAWGFAPGLIPASDAATLPMEAMRGRILETFTPEGSPGSAGPADYSAAARSGSSPSAMR
ncbi:sulfatase [Faunimonas sp. B44]|uniref:sulfatase n=1 Tax=Faunimonas sp. B44 TaxID=3461493 RepID=UPI004044147E